MRYAGRMGKRGPKPRPVDERYWEKVDIGSADECWRWNGGHWKDGRPFFYEPSRGRNVQAFRVGYQLVFGEIAPGLDLDHLCNHSWCVNPNHCWPTTQKENRGRHEREKTHCAKGHEYSDANTWRSPKTGKRNCRACAAANAREFKARKAVSEGRVPGVMGRPWYLRKTDSD